MKTHSYLPCEELPMILDSRQATAYKSARLGMANPYYEDQLSGKDR